MDHVETPRILERLYECQESLRENPLTILAILFTDVGRACGSECHHTFCEVYGIESKTRMTALKLSPVSPEPASMDYGQLNKDIHVCNVYLTMFDQISDFEQSLGKFVKETLNKFEAAREKRGLEPSSHDALYQYIDYRLNAVAMRLVDIRSHQRRCQSQMSVVSHSPHSYTWRVGTSLIRS